jgi:hypothetical protein
MRNIAVASLAGLLLMLAITSDAGYDDDFTRASNLNYYSGITNLQSAQLLINLASIIHQENLQIIKTLQDLEERLNKLEASVKTIEREVVGTR